MSSQSISSVRGVVAYAETHEKLVGTMIQVDPSLFTALSGISISLDRRAFVGTCGRVKFQ